MSDDELIDKWVQLAAPSHKKHEDWDRLIALARIIASTSRAGQPSPDKHAETERNGE